MTRRALPSDPLSLLRESADVTPPEGAAARVAERLASLATAGVTAGAAGLTGLGGPPSWGALRHRFLRWSVAPLGIGIAIGASGQALLAGAPARSQAALPVLPTTPSAVAAPAPVAEPPLERPEVTVAVAASSARPPRSTLVEERLLLDQGRRQLASDEPARALVFLEQHAQRFARGELSEEREAMRINVLVQLGRKDEAKASGEAFAARFPNSIMGASVRAALRSAEAQN
jgi:hypothetical protein